MNKPAFDLLGEVNKMFDGITGPKPVPDTPPLVDRIMANVDARMKAKGKYTIAHHHSMVAAWENRMKEASKELERLREEFKVLMEEVDRGDA